MNCIKLCFDLSGIGWDLIKLYDRIAEAAGREPCCYDCRKVIVSRSLYERMLECFYQAFDNIPASKLVGEYAMQWVIVGPKTCESLLINEALIEEGFFI